MAKKLPASSGDMRDRGSIPGSGRSPGGGHSNPLQYSCLENPMDRRARWAAIHGVAESDMIEETRHSLGVSNSFLCAVFSALSAVQISSQVILTSAEEDCVTDCLSIKKGTEAVRAAPSPQGHAARTLQRQLEPRQCDLRGLSLPGKKQSLDTVKLTQSSSAMCAPY